MRSLASLSVLVPIYNERATIERLLNEVVAVNTGLTLEVLACDDGSTDGTRDILSKLSLPGVKVIFMDENVGRGGVIKHLWTLATGDIYRPPGRRPRIRPAGLHPAARSRSCRIAPTSSTAAASRDRSKGCGSLNRMGNLTMTGAGARCSTASRCPT